MLSSSFTFSLKAEHMYIGIPLLLSLFVVFVCIFLLSISSIHSSVFFYTQSIQIFLRVFLLVLIDIAFFARNYARCFYVQTYRESIFMHLLVSM